MIAWWTERLPQGLTFSLHEFPHVSFSHLLSASRGSHLLSTPSPVSMTGSNNRLENIYLAKVAKSHVVVRCENARGEGGSWRILLWFSEEWKWFGCILRWRMNCKMASSLLKKKKKKKKSYDYLRRGDVKSHLCSSARTVFEDCIFCFLMTHTEHSLCLLLRLFHTDSSSLHWIPAYLRLCFFCFFNVCVFVTAGNVRCDALNY